MFQNSILQILDNFILISDSFLHFLIFDFGFENVHFEIILSFLINFFGLNPLQPMPIPFLSIQSDPTAPSLK